MLITLNEQEVKIARYIGKLRHRSHQGKDDNRRIGPQDDETVAIQGMLAEFAFCKLFNVYPDLEVGGPLPKWDVTLRDGRRFDVKSTTYRYTALCNCGKSHMMVPLWKAEGRTPDHYALIICDRDEHLYEYMGFMETAEVHKFERISDRFNTRGIKSYIVCQWELRLDFPPD